LKTIIFADQSSEMGGAELSLYDIAIHFREHAAVCLLQHGEFERRLGAAGVEVAVEPLGAAVGAVQKRGSSPLRLPLVQISGTVRKLARIFAPYETVYANTQKSFVLAALAKVLSPRKRLIWHLRDILTPKHFGAMQLRVAIGLSNLMCNLVICNSVATEVAYKAAGGRAPTMVIYNGISAAPFEGPLPTASVLPATGDGLLKVGLFGRIAEWKGQHIALAALARRPDCRLYIVGGALFGEEAYEQRVRALTQDLGIADRVVFLGFRDDIAPIMRQMDIILHTSISPEPFGRVIVEGMLAGKPVIASRAGGAIEIIEDGVSGRLVPPDDVDALAATLGELCAQPELRQRLAEAGRARAIAEFSLEMLLQRLEGLLLRRG
jgi:glycosyltransferase involved in cell wall biosynthesis